jgi:predicted AlkP superfamily phosphohydrolase/phosphomutase
MSRIIRDGVHGELRSTIPPASIPAWPTFLTGRNPGKHGVYDFLKKTEGKYIGALTNATDLKASTIFEILSNLNKTSVAINVTCTYPPREMKGCLISGLLTPNGAEYVYPKVLKSELDSMGYIVYVDLEGVLNSDDIVEKLIRMEQKRVQAALYLMNIFDWELFMLMFIGTDTIQHKLWGEKQRILDYYCVIDKLIGEVLIQAGEETNIIVVSDHGFGPHEKTVYINKWLEDLGLLKIKKVDENQTRSYKIKDLQNKITEKSFEDNYLTQIIRKTVQSIRKVPGFNMFKRSLPTKVRKKYSGISRENLSIDWSETQVALSSFFGTETQSIMINLKGREPEGVVERQDYDKIRRIVIENLWKIKDPETNDVIFDEIFTREELYHGPFLKSAPDIVMLFKGEYKASNSLQAEKLIKKLEKVQGSHRVNGIFLAQGPDFLKDKQIKNIDIVDIAPTILNLLKIEVPEDMDGRIISEIIAPN